mmetsp:Transcript_75132/g.215207  ORF Transcript_75132/g.215207 Transcript_75132/m.215207 type:complete len:210 (+) Transcript_75132:293-922(+)
MRLRKFLPRAKFVINFCISFEVFADSTGFAPPRHPLEPSLLSFSGSANNSGVAALKALEVVRAASSRTSATPSSQSFRKSGSTQSQIRSVEAASSEPAPAAAVAAGEPDFAHNASHTAPSCVATSCLNLQLSALAALAATAAGSALPIDACNNFSTFLCATWLEATCMMPATLRSAARRTSGAGSCKKASNWGKTSCSVSVDPKVCATM